MSHRRGTAAVTVIAWLAGLGGLGRWLWTLGDGTLAPPPLLEPGRWAAWVDGVGAVTATFALVRLVCLLAVGYLLVALVVGGVARLSGRPGLVRLSDACSVALVRRILNGAVGVGLTTGALSAGAVPLVHAAAQAVSADAPTRSLAMAAGGPLTLEVSAPTMRPTAGLLSSPPPGPTMRPAEVLTSHPSVEPTVRPAEAPADAPPAGPTMRPAEAPASAPPVGPTMRPAEAQADAPPAPATTQAADEFPGGPPAEPVMRPSQDPANQPSSSTTMRPAKGPPSGSAPAGPTMRAAQDRANEPPTRTAMRPAEGPPSGSAPTGPVMRAAPPARPDQDEPPVMRPHHQLERPSSHFSPDPTGALGVVPPDDSAEPTLATGTGTGASAAAEQATPAEPTTVVLRPGDHLWAVAEEHLTTRLGRLPTDAETGAHWQRLIALNVDQLADPANPDLVFSGQVIRLPAG